MAVSDGDTLEQPTDTRLLPGDIFTDLALRENDEDSFDYAGVANRIADLACAGEPPLSIAIFGPWGSGKSSLAELVRRSLIARAEAPGFVRYDAWRYGGAALRRNFIAHAARELRVPDDPQHHEFHRGLFENRRVAEVSPVRLLAALRSALSLLPVVVAIALSVLALVAVVDLLLFDRALEDTKVILLRGSLIVGGILILAKVLADAGRVEIDQSRPSEEDQFSAAFQRLLDAVTTRPPVHLGVVSKLARSFGMLRRSLASRRSIRRIRRWWSGEAAPVSPISSCSRVVFFIDELDRCREEDVVTTLNAVRTFLDAPRCVFIVAADRDVLERALSRVDQVTPINSVDPYYSTASAFLDKIFQHQMVLPPLRSDRLTRWARDAALRQPEGLWCDLARGNGEQDTPDLEDVLYHLIPSHVRSPRRVKVLLNAYATNVRIAQTRVVQSWPAMAIPLARLTALQVEFPKFAADLRTEPRLPRFMLSDNTAPDSDLIRELVRRWREEDGEEPDSFIAEDNGDGSSSVRRDAARQQRRLQLIRYLERTAEAQDIPRFLLYLNPTGRDFGIEDPELGELVEREATDSPDAVLEALEDRSVGEQRNVARLLAHMVQEVLRPERRNVMTALMAVSERLGDEARPVAREIAESLRAFRVANDLDPRHLPGALAIALVAEGPRSELGLQILRSDGLWTDHARFSAVVRMVGRLGPALLEVLRPRLASAATEWPDLVTDLAATVSETDGVLLLEVGVLDAYITTDPEAGPDAAAERIGHLLAALATGSPRPHLLRTVLEALFARHAEATYAAVNFDRATVLQALRRNDQDWLAFWCWSHAPREEWGEWAQLLGQPPTSGISPFAQEVIGQILTATSAVSAADLDELERLSVIAAGYLDPDGVDEEALLEPVAAMADDQTWATGDDAVVNHRIGLHRLLAALGQTVVCLAVPIDRLSFEDLRRAVEAQPTSTVSHLPGIRCMAPLLTGTSVDELLAVFPDWAKEEDESARVQWLRADITLRFAGQGVDVGLIRGYARHVYLAAQFGTEGFPAKLWQASADAIALWLRARPTARQVAATVVRLGERRSVLVDRALQEWSLASGSTENRRAKANTTVAVALLEQKRKLGFRMQAVSAGGLVDSHVVTAARKILLDSKSSRDERLGVAETLAASASRRPTWRAQVAKLARDLLDRGLYKNDLEVALALLPALDDRYEGAPSLQRSLERHLRSHRAKLTASQAAAAASAGLRPDKNLMTKPGRRAIEFVQQTAEGLGSWIRDRLR